MTIKEIYKIWAPAGVKWVDWVRPVPFAGISQCMKMCGFSELIVPNITYLNEKYKGAALIVDLPGVEGIEEGIGLAKAGYRPIPVYNGTIEQLHSRATVNNQAVALGLAMGAQMLAEIEIKEDALPAFLVDSNRLNRYKMETSLFDNSWDLYHQDLPSAEYFTENGIYRIVVVGNAFSRDLKKILYKFRQKKIEILWTDRYQEPVRITIRKPREKGKG